MSKFLKIGIAVAIIGLIIGGSIIYYIFHMPHRNLENEKAAYVLTAQELFTDFSQDEQVGNEKYGNKAIQVNGKIVEKTEEGYSITLVLNDAMEGVSCSFDSAYVADNKKRFNALSVGNTTNIKGQCDGIDMIMGVVLTRCVIVDESE